VDAPAQPAGELPRGRALRGPRSSQQDAGTPHYFRIQTGRFLIEFVNAVASGDHIHSVLRDFANDLGGDLLAAHHPNPVPAQLPPGWAEDTRKISSSDLDPGLGDPGTG